MDAMAVNNQEALADFVDEALESLRGLPAKLEAYRLAPAQTDSINAIFRAVHSVKGCAAFLDLDAIRSFSHALENALDGVRTAKITLSEELERRLVEGFDRLEAMLQEVSAGRIAEQLSAEETAILDAVYAAASAGSPEKPSEEAFLQELLQLAEQMAAEVADGLHWSKKLRQLAQKRGSDIGTQQPAPAATTPAKAALSDFWGAKFACGNIDATDHVTALLRFFSDFAEGRSSKEAERAFLQSLQEFAAWAKQQGQAELELALQAASADFRMVHESPLDFDANLLSLIWDHLWPMLHKLKVASPEPAAAAEKPAASADQPVAPSPPAAASAEQSKAAAKPAEQEAAKAHFVRVKEEHLDSFLDHVSQLFISTERFRDLQSRMAETGEMRPLVDELRQITLDMKVQSTALQQGVMSLRRVSVAGLFSKFPRMARTLAGQLGKQINVHVVGEETEIDKRLAEDLDSPLVHLVRNVVDHGIEPPEDRKAAAKSETGNMYLEAKQTRDQVVILIRDDGRGMDPARLRAKAQEKGVISAAEAATLSDQESLQLIFRPGFSTAEKVSEVSGRGVGMDVVRTAVQQHGGQVHIESQLGQGTTFRLEVPIRQATLVIDGLMVAEGTDQFVIPFESIQEVAQVAASQFKSVQGRTVATIRNVTYAAMELSELLDLPSTTQSARNTEMAIVVQSKEGRLCLRTDRVVGHRQVVVTQLKDSLTNSSKLMGIAQLGGGRLAPVLSIAEIIRGLRGSTPL